MNWWQDDWWTDDKGSCLNKRLPATVSVMFTARWDDGKDDASWSQHLVIRRFLIQLTILWATWWRDHARPMSSMSFRSKSHNLYKTSEAPMIGLSQLRQSYHSHTKTLNTTRKHWINPPGEESQTRAEDDAHLADMLFCSDTQENYIFSAAVIGWACTLHTKLPEIFNSSCSHTADQLRHTKLQMI